MRRRRPAEEHRDGIHKQNSPALGAAAMALASAGASPSSEESQLQVSLLKARDVKDVLARCCFVGIFVVENCLHGWNFESEVSAMVAPALAPLPREVAVCLHIVHVVLGLLGAVFVIISGFDTAGRTALTKGTSMMLVFMGTITWTWWINRTGIPYWSLDPYPFWDNRCSFEKRNRTVHILKNISIIGALTMFQRVAKYDAMAHPAPPSVLEGLVTALRPWSFTATLAPLLVELAVIRCMLKFELPGYMNTFLFLLSIMSVQATANLVNSYCDFKSGVDTKETAGDRTLVDGLVSPATLKCLAAFTFSWWLCFFAWSVVATGFHPVVLSMATLGTFLAIGYTVGPAPLKYKGLGDFAVFVSFGPALVAYGSTVLVGSVSWVAIAFTAPVTLFVVATLHANNYRDIEVDRRAGAATVAIILGPEFALHYYSVLIVGAHVGALAAGYVFSCKGAFASILVLPQSLWLCVRIRRRATLHTQDEETAKTTMMFGVALALGIVTMPGHTASWHGFVAAAIVVGVLKVFAD